ncbi:MAG: glycolate oxidase, partial [Prevotella sp.]
NTFKCLSFAFLPQLHYNKPKSVYYPLLFSLFKYATKLRFLLSKLVLLQKINEKII